MQDRWGYEIKPGVVVCQPGVAGHASRINDYVVEQVNESGTVNVMWAEWHRVYDKTTPGWDCIGRGVRVHRSTLKRPGRITVLPHITAEQVMNPPVDDWLAKYPIIQ